MFSAEEEEWNEDGTAADGRKRTSSGPGLEGDDDVGEGGDQPEEGSNEENKDDDNDEANADDNFEGKQSMNI